MKTSTRIMKYESQVLKSNPVAYNEKFKQTIMH